MTDDELTDAWQAGSCFPAASRTTSTFGSHGCCTVGTARAEPLLVSGTRQACEVHGCPAKFDAELTQRWSHAIAEAAQRDGLGSSADAFIEALPELTRGDLFGTPRQPR